MSVIPSEKKGLMNNRPVFSGENTLTSLKTFCAHLMCKTPKPIVRETETMGKGGCLKPLLKMQSVIQSLTFSHIVSAWGFMNSCVREEFMLR